MQASPYVAMRGRQNNLSATPSPIAWGTTVTSGAANTKGSFAQLISSASFDVWGFTIGIVNNSLNNAVRNWLIDIAVGGAGSEQVIVSNLLATATASAQSILGGPVLYWFPIFIPKGVRISCRAQCSNAATTLSAAIFLQGGPQSPPWPVFVGADGIGINVSTSSGTPLTAGSTGTESAWTSVGSATSKQYFAIQPMVQTDTNIAMNNLTYHVEWGWSSTTMGERFFITGNIEVVSSLIPMIPDFAFVPLGTQLQVRAECNSTGESLQYGLIGYY